MRVPEPDHSSRIAIAQELKSVANIQICFQEAYEILFKAIRLDVYNIQVIGLAMQRFVDRDELSFEVPDDKPMPTEGELVPSEGNGGIMVKIEFLYFPWGPCNLTTTDAKDEVTINSGWTGRCDMRFPLLDKH